MQSVLYRLADQAGLPRAWRALRPHAVTILTYHGFTEKRSFDGVMDHQRMRLNVGAFRRHVEHLVSNYRVLPLSTLVSLWRAGRPPPKRAVVITFDDGYRSCYTLAHPVLKEFGVPATLFVASDFVSEKRPLWHDRVEYAVHATRRSSMEVDLGGVRHSFRCEGVPEKLAALRALYRTLKRVDQHERDVMVDDLEHRAGARLDLSSSAADPYTPVEVEELRAMVNEGLVEAGCHTKTHAVLSRCTVDQMRVEIAQSKDVIEKMVSRKCDLFCYPNGTKDDFDDRTRALLGEAGFVCALTTIPGRNGASADPMELRRIGAPADTAEFSLAVSGVRAGIARAYRAGKQAIGRRAAAE